MTGSDATSSRDVIRTVIPLPPGHELALDTGSPSIALSPNGRYIAYVARRGESSRLYLRPVGELEARAIDGGDGARMPFFSPDGQWLGFLRDNTFDESVGPRQPPGANHRKPLLRTDVNERRPAFSPDGRWIAYESDESGRYQSYLGRFPGLEPRHQVSTGGGTQPVWNPSGGELFYRSGDKLMAVDVRTAKSLSLGTPHVLFERPSPLQTSRAGGSNTT